MEAASHLLLYEQGIPDIPEIAAYLHWSATSPFLTIVTDEKSIKIEHIRALQTELSTSSAESRLVLITPGEKITLPAQQALLKLLEEPPDNTLIAIPLQSRHSVLPTIQSRCVIIRVDSKKKEMSSGETSLWEEWSRTENLTQKVILTQKFSAKKEELQHIFLHELNILNHIETNKKNVSFRRRLLECVEAIQGNVSPQLCLERLLLQ